MCYLRGEYFSCDRNTGGTQCGHLFAGGDGGGERGPAVDEQAGQQGQRDDGAGELSGHAEIQTVRVTRWPPATPCSRTSVK